MLKALLIDDEQRATDNLQRLIEKFIPGIEQVACCNDARRAAENIHSYDPGLVFLDIRMPYLNGFDILKQVTSKKFKVIFTTAYDEYAIKAIRFSAFDYLLKPIDATELIAAVNRFLKSDSHLMSEAEMFENIDINMQLQYKNSFRLAVRSRDGLYFLMPHEIIHCEGKGNYTEIFATNDRHFLISKTLAEYESLLEPYGFIRTHKSHLVNRIFVSYLDPNGFLVLKNSSKIEMSRRRKSGVMEALKVK